MNLTVGRTDFSPDWDRLERWKVHINHIINSQSRKLTIHFSLSINALQICIANSRNKKFYVAEFTEWRQRDAISLYSLLYSTGVVFTEGTKWSECRRFTMKCLRKFRGSQLSTKSQLTVEARSLVKHFQKLSENGAVRMDNAFNIAVINCLWYSFAGHRFEYDDKKVHEMLETVNESFR